MKKLLCLSLLFSSVVYGQMSYDKLVKEAHQKEASQQVALATDQAYELEKEELDADQAFENIQDLINQMVEAGMSYEEIEKRIGFPGMMLNRGGGMDSGGGDAVIIYDYARDLMSNGRAAYQVYALDLVEFGIQNSLSINYECDEGRTIYSYWSDDNSQRTLSVANNELFDELLEYGGFFGKEVKPPVEILENSQQLKELGDEISRLRSERFKIILDEAADRADQKFFGKKVDPKTEAARNLQISEIDTQLKELNKIYAPEIEKNRKALAGQYYSSNIALAVGLVNKIEEIRKVDSDFAELFEEVLLDLEWQVVDLPVKEIDDEGDIPIETENKIQIASRKHGIVRIAKDGWSADFSLNKKRVKSMTTGNKIAVIVHEVLYEITKQQGDVTSERARNATARLFMKSRATRNIRKAASLIMK